MTFEQQFPLFVAGAVALFVAAAFVAEWLGPIIGRRANKSLQAATRQAYAAGADVDLRLAHKAIAAGDVDGGESRVARAQDKLYSPQLDGQPLPAAADIKQLEDRYGKEFRTLRRRRALDRLGREGAETPPQRSSP